MSKLVTDGQIYQDGDRFIVGRRAWQGGTSVTHGIGVAFTRAEAAELLMELASMTEAAAAELRGRFYTDDRFEAACAAAHYGPAW